MATVQFELTQTDIFPKGVTLFTGVQSSFQGPIASAICFDHLLDGGVLVQLIESGGHNLARQHMQSWALAERHPLDKLRFRVASPENWRDDRDVLRAISDAMAASDIGKPLIVLNDRAQFTTALMPGDPIFPVAREIAATLQCPVALAGSFGHHPAMKPNLDDYRPARVLTVEAGNSINATVTDVRTARRWTATGQYAAGVLLWEVQPVEQREAAHV